MISPITITLSIWILKTPYSTTFEVWEVFDLVFYVCYNSDSERERHLFL